MSSVSREPGDTALVEVDVAKMTQRSRGNARVGKVIGRAEDRLSALQRSDNDAAPELMGGVVEIQMRLRIDLTRKVGKTAGHDNTVARLGGIANQAVRINVGFGDDVMDAHCP
jgi:hypothetical protein